MRGLIPLCAAICLLAGCPAGDARDETPAPTGTQPPGQTATVDTTGSELQEPGYPAVVIDYLQQCLAQPAQEGNAALGPAWLVIARTRHLADAPGTDGLQAAVLNMVEQAGEAPLPELAAAWLAVAPEAATAFLAQHLDEAGNEYLDALWYKPGNGRRLLAGRDLAALDENTAGHVIDMLQYWEPEAADSELLASLAAHPSERVWPRAAGLMVRLEIAPDELHERLYQIAGKWTVRSAVAEGIKLSRDGSFADALVPHVTGVVLGEVDPEAQKDFDVILAAYALAWLPGKQAALMRGKLLGAADPTVRWQVRLGELLQGDPGYWQAAVDSESITDQDLWMTLQPQDAVSIDLLPTYASAARHPEATYRLRAALHLNRYRDHASEQQVQELLANLIDDSNPEVRAVAWYTAGELGLQKLAAPARATVENTTEPGKVRIAAACCAMQLAEPAVATGVNK